MSSQNVSFLIVLLLFCSFACPLCARRPHQILSLPHFAIHALARAQCPPPIGRPAGHMVYRVFCANQSFAIGTNNGVGGRAIHWPPMRLGWECLLCGASCRLFSLVRFHGLLWRAAPERALGVGCARRRRTNGRMIGCPAGLKKEHRVTSVWTFIFYLNFTLLFLLGERRLSV